MSSPLITFLMCSRKQGNPDSNIEGFFDSAIQHFSDEEKERVEFLIKFDTDDEETYKSLLDVNWHGDSKRYVDQRNLLLKYPFNIKYFVYNRGEGRRSLHNDYMFLFSQRNPQSKFISFVTDDCLILRPGMFQELSRLKEQDWTFLGDKEPTIENHKDYRNNQNWRLDVSMFPIVSTRIIECVQNLGWQVNVDNWITLLHVILYHKYGLDFWKGSFTQYVGRAGGSSKESDYGLPYNPMEVNNIHKVENTYYFDLVEQQVRNIWLNYQAEKLPRLSEVIKNQFGK